MYVRRYVCNRVAITCGSFTVQHLTMLYSKIHFIRFVSVTPANSQETCKVLKAVLHSSFCKHEHTHARTHTHMHTHTHTHAHTHTHMHTHTHTHAHAHTHAHMHTRTRTHTHTHTHTHTRTHTHTQTGAHTHLLPHSLSRSTCTVQCAPFPSALTSQ